MKMQKGFTLLEVMIAVVVIAILAMVAVPSYQDYMIRGKVVEATSGLSDGRIKMEQFFQDNRRFDLPASPCPSATAFFTFNCATATTTYTITATGIPPLDNYTYTINQDNVKSSTTPLTNPPDVQVACWVTRKGESC